MQPATGSYGTSSLPILFHEPRGRAAVNEKGKSDVGHAERPFGCPDENGL